MKGKWLGQIVILCCLCAGVMGCRAPEEAAATNRVNNATQWNTQAAMPPGFDFSLLDQAGNFHQLSRYRESRAVVLISHGIGCPIVRQYTQAINALQKEYAEKGVTVLAINPFQQDSREEIQREVLDYPLNVPILLDRTQFVSWSFGMTRTAEVIVIDTQQWKIRYRGPIDARMDYGVHKSQAQNNAETPSLIKFLEQLLADNAPEKPVEMPFKGCAITYDEAFQKRYTYTDDTAQILQQRCTRCHVPGGVAPWAMTDYETVKNWSFMMKEVIKTHRMPPWPVDDAEHVLQNSLALSPKEERTLLLWLNNGSPRGQGDDHLKHLMETRKTTASDWPLGEPDLQFTTETVSTPATGVLPYRDVVIDIGNKEDLYLRAVHLRTNNKRILHHAFAFLQPSMEFQREYQRKHKRYYLSSWNQGIFATYAPGVEGEINPEGVVRFLPAGSKLKLQLHLVTTGKEESGDVSIGLYTTRPKPGDKHYQMDGIFDGWFRIPPGNGNWPAHASMTFDKNATLYEVMPHMHLRGKTMRYTLQYPDGREQMLLSVPRFDFSWQFQYRFKKPIAIPAGATLRVDGSFDNSALNPFNPDPTKAVGFGEQTTDEMFFGYITYTTED